MEERFFITEMYIGTFEFNDKIGVAPNQDYPMRFCVVDTKEKIVIDVEQELKYDYIETVSRLYFINEAAKKIKENKRAAIFPVKLIFLEKEKALKANHIIQRLKNGEKFRDGNDVLNNDEYLESIKIDEQNIQKQNQKVKKRRKRGK